MIERLHYYPIVDKYGNCYDSNSPNTSQIVDKINEIIDTINQMKNMITKNIGDTEKIRNDSLNCQDVPLKWSEEDDEIFDKVVNSLIDSKYVDSVNYNIMYDWLNSIKQRMEE